MLEVLRLGHRAGRDDRISTHVGLTARQWGADKVTYAGEYDSSMMESLENVIGRWGGSMGVEYEEEWYRHLKAFDGLKIHLTMYGESVGKKLPEIEEELDEDIMVVVGAEKVPRKVYTEVDYNIGVGHQPHSEIAALAVFLDRLRGLKNNFSGAEVEVEPSEQSKLTREK